MKKLKPLKNTFKNRSKGCLICGLLPIKLPMNYKLIEGFGDNYITKNNKIFFRSDSWDGTKESWKKARTLMWIENKARKDPNADWRVINIAPLHGEVYQRQGRNNWVLVKKDKGFA